MPSRRHANVARRVVLRPCAARGQYDGDPDALNDNRFHDNPLVTGAPGIRFTPVGLTAPNGAPIGTLCLIDTRPRSLEPDELALLGDLAHMTEREIAALHSRPPTPRN